MAFGYDAGLGAGGTGGLAAGAAGAGIGVVGTGSTAGFSICGREGSRDPGAGAVPPGCKGKAGSVNGMGMNESLPERMRGFSVRRASSGAIGPT